MFVPLRSMSEIRTQQREPRRLVKGRDFIPADAVLCYRPHKWGNQFHVGEFYDGVKISRHNAVRLYKEWLEARPWKLEEVKAELRGKDLVCYCTSDPCHAEVLLSIANNWPVVTLL